MRHKVEIPENLVCPRCGNKNPEKMRGHGTKGTVSKGERQRYQCTICWGTYYDESENRR